MVIDKKKFLDNEGRPRTQSLFLELGYNDDVALYTFKENDYIYKGKKFLAIKRLYLELADVTEYEFANTYFLSWPHWNRLCENKNIRAHIDQWREELELKMKTIAVKEIMSSAKNGSFQASRWLASRGWKQEGAGRPSKEDIARERKMLADIENEYSADVIRLRQK